MHQNNPIHHTSLHSGYKEKQSKCHIHTHTQKHTHMHIHTQNSRINILLLITNIYVYRYCACWFFLIATFYFSQAMLTFFLLQHLDMLLWLLTMKEKKCSSFKQPVHVSHVQGFNHFHPLEYYSPCWSSKQVQKIPHIKNYKGAAWNETPQTNKQTQQPTFNQSRCRLCGH